MSFAEPQYIRDFSADEFYETMCIYQYYLKRQAVSSLYGTGFSMLAIGLSQSYPDVIGSGLLFLGQGLAMQSGVLQTTYEQSFAKYRTQVYGAESKEAKYKVVCSSIESLIEDERSGQLLTGGNLVFNGLLLLLNEQNNENWLAAVLMAFGIKVAFFEVGPLEQMVKDYGILNRDAKTTEFQPSLPGMDLLPASP